LEEAEEYHRREIALRERLAAELPTQHGEREQIGHSHRLWGFRLWQAGRRPEAEQVLHEALAVFAKLTADFPDVPAHWHFLADTHRRIGGFLAARKQFPEAEQAYRQAIEIHQQRAARFPDQPVNEAEWAASYLDLGALLAATGRGQEAKRLYREGIEVSPQSAVVHNNLAWMLATASDPRVRDPGQAVELAKKAVELAPKAGGNWNTLGVAHYRAGDWKAAIEALMKARVLNGAANFSFDAFFLAMAHEQLGQMEQARRWYDQAVQWMEKHQPKNEELGRLRAEAATLPGIARQP
jgi:tetratricopeptide (TPR) repeat protein